MARWEVYNPLLIDVSVAYIPHLPNALQPSKYDTNLRHTTTYHQSLNPQLYGNGIVQLMAIVIVTTSMQHSFLHVFGDLIQGSVTGTY